MEHDPDYLAWVASNCERRCPDGERKDQFCERICTTFAALVDQALAEGEQMLVILAHGAPRWRRWIAMLCRTGITTSGARPMRAALCWTPGTGKRSISCTL